VRATCIIGTLYQYALVIAKRPLVWMLRPLFKSHGKRLSFDPFGYYTYATISIGDYVTLGRNPCIIAAKSEIRIGNKVMFGPEVVLIGGGHNTSVVGRYMYDVTEKQPTDDLGIIIEDDVWVGARAIILRGVTIGRGSIVGAGAVVKKSMPPYAIIGGNPAKVLKFRWDIDTILRHEESLYKPELRYTRDQLHYWQQALTSGELSE
jgi:acetyltransferase-like isoleucine patch superfamily enzyme